jgi:hypothetical protein
MCSDGEAILVSFISSAIEFGATVERWVVNLNSHVERRRIRVD